MELKEKVDKLKNQINTNHRFVSDKLSCSINTVIRMNLANKKDAFYDMPDLINNALTDTVVEDLSALVKVITRKKIRKTDNKVTFNDIFNSIINIGKLSDDTENSDVALNVIYWTTFLSDLIAGYFLDKKGREELIIQLTELINKLDDELILNVKWKEDEIEETTNVLSSEPDLEILVENDNKDNNEPTIASVIDDLIMIED